jgi:hypothetical protein
MLDELAPWRLTREHKIRDEYIAEYLLEFPSSEPTNDFDDRNALYNM